MAIAQQSDSHPIAIPCDPIVESRARQGKGLQLVFRMATTADIKPAKRGVSRWYGEQAKDRRLSGGKAANDKRAARRDTSCAWPASRPASMHAVIDVFTSTVDARAPLNASANVARHVAATHATAHNGFGRAARPTSTASGWWRGSC